VRYELPRRDTPGGRGARARILQAATQLFHEEGINATGVGRLAEVAQVSKQTLYKHFASKDEVVEAYLRRFEDERDLLPTETRFDDEDLPPRERLLSIFDGRERGRVADVARTCPFVAAAVEFPDPGHPAHRIAAEHKRAFIAGLAAAARAAGATDPDALAHQLALLYDGAASEAMVFDSADPGRRARALAATLIDQAVAAA
jgi:AcrR family transcriptional regulator